MRYHHLTVHVVMRDCDNAEDAKEKFTDLMVHYPDVNTVHMESWEVVRVVVPRISGFADYETQEDALESLDALCGICCPGSSFWIDDDFPCRVMTEATVEDWNRLNLDLDFMRL